MPSGSEQQQHSHWWVIGNVTQSNRTSKPASGDPHAAQGTTDNAETDELTTVSDKDGLTDRQVEESRSRFGDNVLTPPERTPWWKQLLEKFDDPIIRVLMVAAVIAVAVGSVDGSYVEGIGIIIAILLATVLAFLNEYRAAKEFELLNETSDEIPVNVVRNGTFTSVPRKDLVQGDIVLLELGQEVPADGELMSSVSLRVDESRLTGESMPVLKKPSSSSSSSSSSPSRRSEQEADGDGAAYPEHLVMRGTTVMDGHGVFRTTSVGDRTELGRTARAAAAEQTTPTPLTRQLERLSKLIGVVAFGVAAALFLALVIRGVVLGEVKLSNQQWVVMGVLLVSAAIAILPVWLPVIHDAFELAGKEIRRLEWLERSSLFVWAAALGAALGFAGVALSAAYFAGSIPSAVSDWVPPDVVREYLRYFMVAVTIIVVAVPEGLPMSVTLSLAYSMRRMAATNNLVRQMHACETIGAATVICSDKTGTLTYNQMRVQELHFPSIASPSGGETRETDGPGEDEPDPLPDGSAPEARLLAEAMAANSTANLKRPEQGDAEPLGNPTEGALLLWLEHQGVDYTPVRERFEIEDQLAFSSQRKFMATLGRSAAVEDEIAKKSSLTLHVKGAPEIVIDRCDTVLTQGGEKPIEPHIHEIHGALERSQSRGMRTIGFAFSRPEEPVSDGTDLEDMAHAMCWLGFVGIADPVRPEVPGAIEECHRAGIEVKMVTGDNPKTATEIARRVGLWEESPPPGAHISGPAFAQLDDAEARERVAGLKVMSRARPDDKLRLVKLLKEQDEVVAVTGDGTNDGPALNMADVGLSMGKTGTAVAKEASDIVLLDDSFPSIVQGVKWGRSLYENIQRFIVFQLTINVSALGTALLGPFVGIKLPFTVTQMLWVNLIMDTFAALALATEPPHESVMERPPRDPAQFIITGPMGGFILGVGMIFLAAMITLLLRIRSVGVTPRALSIFFTAFVLAQFWNLFNARVFGRHVSAFAGILANKAFLLIAGLILVGQFVIVQVGGPVFRTVPLELHEWGVILATTSLVIWIGEIWRFVARLKEPSSTTGLAEQPQR